MKVLIAEDDSTSAIVLRKALEKLGHETVVATDGEQAHTLLASDTAFEYRVVISDWMMPGMDGLELTRKLRGEYKPGAPYRFVILLTARGRPEDRRAGLEAGADDFMVKPMDMGDLIPRLSIAERMLRLEDAVAAKANAFGSPPAPGGAAETQFPRAGAGTAESSRATGERPSPLSPLALPESGAGGLPSHGEEAAKQILLAAVREFDAGEVHFEPQMDGTYRVQVRDANGSLHTLSDVGDVPQAAKYLVSQADGKTLRFGLAEQTMMATVAVLPVATGDRLRVALLPASLLSVTVSLADLPMSAATRGSLEAVLRHGKQNGGILFVAGAKRHRYLKNQTLAALRHWASDPDTIVLDDTHSRRQDRLLSQSPDVIVSYDFGGKSGEADFIMAAQVHGVLVLTATDVRIGDSSPIYPTLLGTLTVLPLSPDGSNAEDRYELKTVDEPSAR